MTEKKAIVKKPVRKAPAKPPASRKAKAKDPLHDVQKVVDAITDAVDGDTAALEAIVEDAEAAEDIGSHLPFPDDKRPLREQANDHEYLVVLVYIAHGDARTKWYVADWQHDWFDNQDAADEWAKEVRIWATDDCREHGDWHYAIAVVRTGYPLDILSVSAHGYVDNTWRLSVCQSVTRTPEKVLFKEGVESAALKPKVPIRKGAAKKGIVAKGNAPVPKGARRKPVRQPGVKEDGVAPVVRSKGFRAKVRGAKGAA